MAGKKMNNKTVTYNNNDNSEKMTRSAYLEGKAELTDEDIIALLDLPSEKYDNNFINHYTDKTYKELRDVPEEISKLVGILKSKPEYLKYHNTYISKTKILFEQSSTLYNEIPCLIVLNELNKSAYLLPYEFAKGDNDNVRAFADSLKEDVFTDFKRVFAAKIKKSLEGGMKQGQDLFVIINNENLEKGMIKEQLENYEDRRSHKKGLFLFYSEKDYKCYSFEFDEKGILKEEIDYDLKKLRLAISDKPVTPNPRELSSPQSSNLNIQQNQNSVNELFFSLLTRGEIEFFKKADIKQFPDKDKKYKNALKNLQTYKQYMSSQIITNSNTEYYQNEISSRYYQLINNESQIDSQGENTMEKTLQTLNDNYGFSFIAPDYWNNDDISKWNEMTVKDGLNLEIVSMLDFVTEATKVINGEKPLEYINNLDYMKLPKKIESMEELVNQEKEHRNSAYELFQKEYQIETQQNTQEAVADVVSQENFSENVESVSEEKMTFTDKNVRSLLLDYCEPFVKTAYYKELFGEQKNEFTDEEIRKLSKSINLGDLLNTLDEKSLRDFAKDTGIPVSSDDERQKKLIVEGIKKLQKKETEQSMSGYNDEDHIDKIMDSGIESVQVNGGLSDAAIEAELAAYENPKPDYLDEQGNPHWFDEEEETEDLSDEEIEQLNEQQPVSQNKTEFEPLYFGDITENGEVNVYTKEQYFERFGEEPDEASRLDDEQVEKWNFEDYIHSEEFVSKFGDWEKANRLEKLKEAEPIIGNDSITVEGVDVSDLVIRLRENYSKGNLKQLQKIAEDVGKEKINSLRKEKNLDDFAPLELVNKDSGKSFKLKTDVIYEIDRHNLFQTGHIEALQSIDKLIEDSIYIGSEKNEDNRNPKLKEFFYFGSGMKINGEDYTAKSVFVLTENGELYYDQSLSEIEKGLLIDILQEKNKLETSSPQKKVRDSFEPDEVLDPLMSQENSNKYYDKRLINICQVPQMPYLERNPKTGKWQPTKEAVNLVKSGKLHIEKHGQSYSMVNAMEEPGNIISDTDKKQAVTEQSTVQDNTIPDLSDTSDIQIPEESYQEIPPESESYEEFVPDFTDDADVNPGDFLPVYDGVFNVSEEDQTFLDAMDKEREEHEKWLHETKEGQKKLKEMESEVHEDTKFEGFPVSSQSESNTAKISENLQKKAALHKFFVENAYKEKTPVPAFGYRNAKTGHIVVLEGWEFSKTETYTRDVWDEEKQEWKADDKERHGGYNSVTDDLIDGIKKQPQFIKDENGNQIENPDFYTYRKTDPIVVLTKMEGDKQIEMRIPAEQYATQIRNSCILKNAAEITEEKLQEYRQKAQLDENEQRPNNAENFTHNFTAFCRKGANSVQEAMDFAIHNLIGNMRPEEREKLKTQMLEWEKKSGKSYTERLTEEYKQNVSDKPIIDKTAFDRNVLDSIRYNTEVIDREGAKLDKSCKLTVGESVKMQLSVPDCLGRKNYKLPVQNLVLVSHCPDNNSVVLMDEKHLSKYILPRDEFIKNVQKYEKKQERSNSRTSRQEERNAISMSD